MNNDVAQAIARLGTRITDEDISRILSSAEEARRILAEVPSSDEGLDDLRLEVVQVFLQKQSLPAWRHRTPGLFVKVLGAVMRCGDEESLREILDENRYDLTEWDGPPPDRRQVADFIRNLDKLGEE